MVQITFGKPDIVRKFNNSYIIALSLIAFFTIASQLVIQFFLKNQKLDAKIINIAGRQRMLSQKITKHTFLIANAKDSLSFVKEKQKLKEAFNLWFLSHQALLEGDEALGLPFQEKSQENTALFQQLVPHYQRLKESSEKILALNYSSQSLVEKQFLPEIIRHEPDFLVLMNKIVLQYEVEANEKVENLGLIEVALMIITLLTLLLEAILIFRPVVKKTKLYVKDIKEKNQTLLKQEEELKQNLEEITAIQENLEENQKNLKIALAENLSISAALDKSAIISITDLKGNIIKVNEVFCKVSGFTEKEVIGRNQRIINSGYHPKGFWKKLWSTVGKGQTWRDEVKNKTKNGDFYWVDAVVNPIYDENGRIYRYFSIRYLITERKVAEQKLTGLYRDINASIQYAQRIQKAVLPAPDKLQTTLPESFVFFRPLDIVSGDFYFYAQKGHSTILVAADCTGHGVPGAFMSLIGNDLLYEIVNVLNITDPDKILNLLRQEVIRVLNQKEENNEDGMDIVVCTIHLIPEHLQLALGKPHMEYAGAMNPIIYFQEGKIHQIKGDRIIIGGVKDEKEVSFTKHRIALDKPTVFYIFSDGIQDQFGGKNNKKFTPKRLRNLLQEVHQKPMQEQKEIISSTIEDWRKQGQEKQIDDMLLIGVKV